MSDHSDLRALAEDAALFPEYWAQPNGDSIGDQYLDALDPKVVLGLLDEIDRLYKALVLTKAGQGSMLWLANNIHNAGSDTFREFFASAVNDWQKGYDAADAAIKASSR